MPHLTVEYSENLAEKLDLLVLLKDLQKCLASDDDANIDGARILARAHGTTNFISTDQYPDAFIAVELRLLKGRTSDVRKNLAAKLHDTSCAFLEKHNLKACVTVEAVELADSYCGTAYRTGLAK